MLALREWSAYNKDMARRYPVRLARDHVRAAVLTSVFVAGFAFVVDAVQHGLTTRVVLPGVVYLVVLAAALTWSNWRADNRLERVLRARHRGTPVRSKAR